MANVLESRHFARHSGASDRPRGRNSRQPGKASSAPRKDCYTETKIWDGKSKTSIAWSGLDRDPELWMRDGNCFVHLFACGQSRQGPSFRVPISTLLASQCHSLIDRFIVQKVPGLSNINVSHTRGATRQSAPTTSPLATVDYLSQAHLIGRVDLFIPPPPDADHDETYLYYLAIRNLLAWVFRRPVAGKFLGKALSSLYSSMCEFRHPRADNVQDLLSYIADEGYIAMAGDPVYALAMLQLSETMRHRTLYVNAFCHCVGLYNDLHLGSEYAHIDSATRKLIRKARLEMDMRLGSAGSKLRNFLEEQLSEAHLSLPETARLHLDQFRAHLQSYYTLRLGQYPPASIDARSTIFEPRVYRMLADDFKALYEYLVDESFTTDAASPVLAQGGFCVLQSVTAFDQRYGFTSLECPLPLLPEVSFQQGADAAPTSIDVSRSPSCSTHRNTAKRRLSWLGGTKLDKILPRIEKLKPDSRLLANTALLKASNKAHLDLWRNEFVAAYRQFEEDVVSGLHETGGIGKKSLIDVRKVCWILVYAVHQTLQHCFLPPPAEVRGAAAVSYHLSISPHQLHTWIDECDSTPLLLSRSVAALSPSSSHRTARPFGTTYLCNPQNSRHVDTFSPARCMSITAVPDATLLRSVDDAVREGNDHSYTQSPVFDIRPDIDYLGLANRDENSMAPLEGEEVILPRSRSLSQTSNFRRSLSLFRGGQLVHASVSDGKPKSFNQRKNEPLEGSDNGTFDPLPVVRTMSLRNTMTSRRNSFSQHLSLLSNGDKSKSNPQQSAISRERRSLPYHEIIVHGYGNGTNPVQLAVSTHPAALAARATNERHSNDSVTTPSTTRSLSTSSTNSNSSAETTDTALTEPASTFRCIGNSTHHNVTDYAARDRAPETKIPEADVGLCDIPISPQCVSNSPPKVHKNANATTCASMAANPCQVPGADAATSKSGVVRPYSTTSAPVPPPVPHRSSARQRRFSVYGGGDEYASLTTVLPSSSAQRSQNMILDPQRQMPLRSRTQPTLAINGKGMTMFNHHFGMEGKAPLSVNDAMAQRADGDLFSLTSRMSWCAGVVALRSVHEEEDELTAVGAAAPPARTRSSTLLSMPVRHSHRHSSYTSCRSKDDGHDYIQQLDRINVNNSHQLLGEVQPEWEKFAMGLGGHTIV